MPSLAQIIGRRGVPGVARLLRLRPDLADPEPVSLSDLAARSVSRASTVRALAGLDEPALRVLIGVAAGVPEDLQQREAAGRLPQLLAGLAERILVWDDPPQVTSGVTAALGRFPAGLAPTSADPMAPDAIVAALGGLDEAERHVLERLTWGPPTGRLRAADRPVQLAAAASPVDRLLARGLLRPVDSNTVLLPREVALELRGARLFNQPPVIGAEPAPSVSQPSAARARGLAERLLSAPPAVSGRGVLDEALTQDRWVELDYATEDGATHNVIVRVLTIGHGAAYLVRRHGPRLTVPLSRIVSAQLGGPVVINDPPPSRPPSQR